MGKGRRGWQEEKEGLGKLRDAGKNAFSESGGDRVHTHAGSSDKQECHDS